MLGKERQIREGSAAKDFEALHPLIREYPAECMFCSDDKHPHELVEGHINQLVQRAVALGYDLFDVLHVATVNPTRHYRLDVGLLQPGDPADLIEVANRVELRFRREFGSMGSSSPENGQTLVPQDTDGDQSL